MNINKRIKEIRECLSNNSNKEFSEKLNVSSQAISNYVRDGYNIGREVIENILKAFPQLDANWLLMGEGNMLKNISDMPQVSDPQIISLLREQITDLKDTIDRKDREINNLNQEIGRLKGILDENKIQYRQTGT